MSKKKYEVVATVGKYTTKSGEEKKRYLNIGTVFENDKGQLSMKLDSIPVGPEWSGWVSFFEPKEREWNDRQPPANQDQHLKDKGNGYQRQDDQEDDIPF
jgi:hypothetical protein